MMVSSFIGQWFTNLLERVSIVIALHCYSIGSYPDFLYRRVIKQAREQAGSPSMAVRYVFLCPAPSA